MKYQKQVPKKRLKNNFIVLNKSIVLSSGLTISAEVLADLISATNSKFTDLEVKTQEMSLNIFEIIDLRMLSGFMGETLIDLISASIEGLEKNPNIDGYPDLLDVSQKNFMIDFRRWKNSEPRNFIQYPYGGIEVKNTFGTKKSKSNLLPSQRRIKKINKKLDWKAHHRYTNGLLGIYSDYIDNCPQIVAAMYSDNLVEEDWKEKQNPKSKSTMTSFSVIEKSGWIKLKAGLLLCKNEKDYLDFFLN